MPRAVLLVVAAGLVLSLGGCDRGSGDAESPPTPALRAATPTLEPEPEADDSSADNAVDAIGEFPGIAPFEPADGTVGITSTMQIVALPDDVDARPGPWSPDGAQLVAFKVVGDDPIEGAVGRVIAVDNETGGPAWDSGDVQDALTRAPGLVAWRPDGTLVLPRADGMFVAADEDVAFDSEGFDGQPREILLSPDGRSVFANGPDGSWLVDPDGRVSPVTGRPAAGFSSWSWSPDGTFVGLARTNGDYYLLDVASADAERVAKAPPASLGGRMPQPRWLSDGRMLLSQATKARTSTGSVLDFRIVHPDGGRGDSLPGILGLPLNEVMPADASAWVSPNGAWIVYPVTEPDPDAPATSRRYLHTGSLLVDVNEGRMRPLPAVVDPVWSPDSRRVAFKADDSLAVFDRIEGGARFVAEPPDGVDDYIWSPDGHWLLYIDGSDALWIASADGLVEPARLADRVAWEPEPSWSPTGDRLAASVVLPDEGQRLVMYTIGLDG